jgi:GrpB-like predicted nucleotidyltransferase (UPF0157 family)
VEEQEILAAHVGEPPKTFQQVLLVDYNPEWPALYERERVRIEQALGAVALRIEHVGSTSVPGLAAKPVIDIVVVVADSSREQTYLPALEAAGYILRIREPELDEHRMFVREEIRVHLHVFSQGCEEIDKMVGFRDRLRSNDLDRELYEWTKRELAAREWKYVQNYADAKADVVREILSRTSGPSVGTSLSDRVE